MNAETHQRAKNPIYFWIRGGWPPLRNVGNEWTPPILLPDRMERRPEERALERILLATMKI